MRRPRWSHGEGAPRGPRARPAGPPRRTIAEHRLARSQSRVISVVATDVRAGPQAHSHGMTATETELDPAEIEAATTHVLQIYGGTMLNYMIDIGHRTGLL